MYSERTATVINYIEFLNKINLGHFFFKYCVHCAYIDNVIQRDRIQFIISATQVAPELWVDIMYNVQPGNIMVWRCDCECTKPISPKLYSDIIAKFSYQNLDQRLYLSYKFCVLCFFLLYEICAESVFVLNATSKGLNWMCK